MEDVLHFLPRAPIGSGPIFDAVRAHWGARDAARRYRKNAAKQLGRIAQAAAAEDHERAAYLRRLFCDALCARFVAAEAENQELDASERHSLVDLIALVKRLNARHGTDEPVRVYLKPKSSGGARSICQFGFRNKVLQRMVLMALEAGTRFHPAQFNVPGRGGLPAAKQAVHEAYASGVYKYVVQMDVRNCFPSFTATGVAENLPVPRQVTNAVIMMDNLQVILSSSYQPSHHHRVEQPTVTGLPQGSVCSPIVQSILLKPLLDVVPPSARAVMWADNMIVLFRTRAEAEQTIMDLHEAARRLPSGPVQLIDGGIGLVSGKQIFLGSAFQRRKGRGLTTPTAAAKNCYIENLARILEQPPSRKRDVAVHSHHRGFMSGHRLWSEVAQWTGHIRAVLDTPQSSIVPVRVSAAGCRLSLRRLWSRS